MLAWFDSFSSSVCLETPLPRRMNQKVNGSWSGVSFDIVIVLGDSTGVDGN